MMTSLAEQVKVQAAGALQALFPEANIQEKDILVNETKPEFKGDYTVVLFPFVKALRQNPLALGNAVGTYLVEHHDMFTAHETVSGFLNLSVADSYWTGFLGSYSLSEALKTQSASRKMMVEYSSPNTNKPLHLGHLRNNFLGIAVANMLEAAGEEVVKTCVVNDRGVHICKSMIAWQLFGEGKTPEQVGVKGDHFVGDFYVKFNDEHKRQIKELVASGMEEKQAEQEAPIMKATQQMLVDWEAGKPEVIELWKKMNGWVYEGFDATYKAIGSTFDKVYYESNTYLLGKDLVEEGLAKGVFYQKEDGSVWIDLTADGLDEKLVRRKDGTSVYITQDIGLAVEKQKEYGIDESIYVVGDEQNYHFKVLKLICQKLGLPASDGIYHLSYGMVELPTGKMKSREGTVVDADELVEEMVRLSKEQTEASGKTGGFSEEELADLYEMIGVGALKFYLLRVEPKKKMIFNPEESIDLHGFTATFIQYAHARICSVLRKGNYDPQLQADYTMDSIMAEERGLMVHLEQYPAILLESARAFNPGALCNYSFKLAQLFNTFYDKCSIANADTEAQKQARMKMAALTAQTLKHAMSLLGIRVPEKM